MKLKRYCAGFLMCCLCATSSVRAELLVVSQVEVRAERAKPAGFIAELIGSLLPFSLSPGRATVTTVSARGQVRVTGMGPVLDLAPDVVLISRHDGTTICLQPADSTYFVISALPAAAVAAGFQSDQSIRRRGKSDVILGAQTERVSESIRVLPHKNAPPSVDAFGRSVDSFRSIDAWTPLNESPEQRTARFLYSDRSPQAQWEEVPLQIESWTSDKFGDPSRVIAQAGSSVTALATAGMAGRSERGFALRQTIHNPTGGYRVESRVTSTEAVVVADSVFEIPADYRQVVDPRPGMRPPVKLSLKK